MEIIENLISDLIREEEKNKTLAAQLEKQERDFTRKLEKLCEDEKISLETDEEKENELEERLSALEAQFKNFSMSIEKNTAELATNQSNILQRLQKLSDTLRYL